MRGLQYPAENELMNQHISPNDVFGHHAQRLLTAGVSAAVTELITARCVEGRLVLRGSRGEVLGMVVVVLGADHVRAATAALDTLSVP